MPGGRRSSHTLGGCNPLTETREPLPSTFPPSVHLLLQRTADISPGSQQRESERKGDLGRWAHLGGSRFAQPGTDLWWRLLAGRETWGPPLTPQWEAAHQSDTWLGAKQDGDAIRGLYLPSRETVRWRHQSKDCMAADELCRVQTDLPAEGR